MWEKEMNGFPEFMKRRYPLSSKILPISSALSA